MAVTFLAPHFGVLLVQLGILSDITGWFGEVWDQIKAVDVKYLVIG